jgi:hypothetical protein
LDFSPLVEKNLTFSLWNASGESCRNKITSEDWTALDEIVRLDGEVATAEQEVLNQEIFSI